MNSGHPLCVLLSLLSIVLYALWEENLTREYTVPNAILLSIKALQQTSIKFQIQENDLNHGCLQNGILAYVKLCNDWAEKEGNYLQSYLDEW